MKTKTNKTTKDGMQTHIDAAFVIINEFLPCNYAKLVQDKLPKYAKVSDQTISKVKRRRLNIKKNLVIFEAIYKVALDNKKANESFLKTLKK